MWPEDQDLEHIFKEGSNRHEYPYDAAAWQQMELMLDKQRRRKFLFWILGIGLVLAIGAITYFGVYQDHNSLVMDEDQAVFATSPEAAEVSGTDINTSTTISENDNHEIATVNNSNITTEAVPTSSDNLISSKKEGVKIAKRNTALMPKNEISNDYKKSRKITSVKDLNLVEENNNIDTKSTAVEIASNSNQDATENIVTLTPVFISSLARLNMVAFVNIADVGSQPSIIELKEFSDNTKFRRFMITGFAGAESSWTPNGEYSSIDLSVGIKTSYLLSNKLAVVVAGNIRSDSYIAGPDDYAPTNKFWENGIAPEYTDANCSMIEMSTGVSYAFRNADQSGLVLSGLLVSNFMLKENYDYHFEDGTKDFSSSWNGANNTVFSNLEIGLGYRSQFKNGRSLEFTPYIKLPVNGIGHGNLMLSSFGLRMGYNLGF